ncbi:hypothetical protein GCM10028808_74960 [Spirosoma migulaei]
MSTIQKLFESCQAEVIVFYNGHKSTGESVDEYLTDWGDGQAAKAISQEVYIEMIKRDTVIVIQFYPFSPLDYKLVFHYDLEQAAEQALAILL